jgi:hypothetical protein
MKISYLTTLSALIFLSCGCAITQKDEPPITYKFTTSDDRENNAFIVFFRSSEDKKRICIDVQSWPNKAGAVHYGGDAVKIIHDAGMISIRDSNLGYCPNGCGSIRIKPNQEIRAVIPYSEFGDPKEIAALENKRIDYSLAPYRCK